eukprot:s2342_g9.t1
MENCGFSKALGARSGHFFLQIRFTPQQGERHGPAETLFHFGRALLIHQPRRRPKECQGRHPTCGELSLLRSPHADETGATGGSSGDQSTRDFTVAIFRDSPDWYAASHTTNVAFACGENGSGQCGRSMHQQQQVWSQVRLPKHSRVDQLRCGQAHCLALLKDGRLFAWGSNPQGQVGNGRSDCRRILSQPDALEAAHNDI